MDFFKRYRALHLWLLADLAVLALFLLCRGNRAVMNALTTYATEPLKRALGGLCSLTTVSVAEVIYVAVAGIAVLCLCTGLRALVRSTQRRRTLWRMIQGTLCTVLTVYTALCLLWGANYYIDSFQDRSGIHARSASMEELTDLTAYFADQLSQTYAHVARDENGSFAVPREEIFAAAPTIYEASYEEFPFLRHKDRMPKAFVNSRVLSAMGFTGFYFPFTGETNLNIDCPASFLPATIVHELGHQRGIASEQECNFLAVVVSLHAKDPVYRYSGALMGYLHLGNALYQADPAAWQTIRDTLPEPVIHDLVDNNRYWDQFDSPTQDAAQSAYDSFLKNYGDEDGVQSYGMVVDLLIAYYLDYVGI